MAPTGAGLTTSEGEKVAGQQQATFPFELQVAQLLQDNVVIIECMRANMKTVQFSENQPLMEGFYRNTQTIFSLLTALPCNMPPLPPQCRVDETFLGGIKAQEGASVSTMGATHGQQAGVVFPHHPTAQPIEAASSEITAAFRPPSLATSLASGAVLPPSGVGNTGDGLPAASPANAVFALKLSQMGP